LREAPKARPKGVGQIVEGGAKGRGATLADARSLVEQYAKAIAQKVLSAVVPQVPRTWTVT